MESGNNNRFDGAGWEAHISQWKEDTAASDSLSESDPTASSQKALSDPASRRRFLRTTVAAGAVVTGVVAAGGVVYAAKGPQILASLAAGNSVPSGHCVHIVEGVKGSTHNPNQHIQVSTTDFQTYIGSISGSTFTISHGVGVLVDKNGHSPNFAVCITDAAYKGGGTNTVSLTVNPAVTDEYPTGSCLYISQTHGTC
jgi:hypothetical protein